MAAKLLERLWREVEWQQHSIRLYGRELPQPRLTAWQGDPGITYRYSGLSLQAAGWHSLVLEQRQGLQQQFGLDCNSVLLNAYRDGRDAMGWHADDEPELGPEPVIASLSLGATRRFLVRARPGGKSIPGSKSTPFDLEHGSLLLMRGSSQADYQHALPRTRRAAGLRLNLTFRTIRIIHRFSRPTGQRSPALASGAH